MKNKNSLIKVTSLVIGIITLSFAYFEYGWQLPLILFLFGWSMNIDNRK